MTLKTEKISNQSSLLHLKGVMHAFTVLTGSPLFAMLRQG